ncbi:MAG: 4Fe-4S binding protein [Thermoplasmata archaeon]|nr:MAG: 4Fe-4S binding protein [Thermoplasmata archaeon]
MPAEVNEALCSGCRACLSRCPYVALKMEEGHATVVAQWCRNCGYCVDQCGEEAIWVHS